MEILTVDDRPLVVIQVVPSDRRPHHLVTEGAEQGVYVRLGSSNRQADSGLIQELERPVRRRAFDQLPAHWATLEDLDIEAVTAMLGRKVEDNDLRSLGLVTVDQEGRVVPTNGGILLAGRYREEMFPHAWVQCRFRGDDKVDIFDQTEIHSHLPRAIGEAMEFIAKHAYRSAKFGGVFREDVWSVPMDALRELITNAIAHAAWGTAVTPARVAFFDDRIEVESPGGVVPGMTVEDMLAGISVIRNPTIVRFFREMHLMEQWGSGVRRVADAVRAQGVGDAAFLELPGRLRVVVPIPRHDVRVSGIGADEQDGRLVHSIVEEYPLDLALEPRAISALRTAVEHPVRRGESMSATGLSNAYANYKRHIVPLIDQGFLALTLPDKPTSKNQRYVPTELGRRVLEESAS